VRSAAIAFGLCACSVTAPDGDPFPIHVDLDQGPVLVHVGQPGQMPVPATLDVLAPFTLMDPGTGVPVQTESTTLLLYGEKTPGSTEIVERAHFAANVVLLHPCDQSAPSCTVGQPSAPTPIGAVLGADAVGSSAIRFDFPNHDVFVFPGIAGDDTLRDQECDARFPSPFRGGGTLVLGGADVPFDGRRVAIGACMGTFAPPPPATGPNLSGTNALFVFSTGLGPTILGATPYARYCEVPEHGCNPDASGLPGATVLLTSGPVTGHLSSISNLTLVANPSQTSRGPCGDLYASHCLVDATCAASDPGLALCKNRTPCGAPAAVALSASIPIVVVPDDEPTLQALRAELRPDQPEVDGVLGVDAMRALQLDVDYPNNRLLARCDAGQAGCAVRRTLASLDQAYQLTDTTGRGCGEPP
jgi:hypothetical protein